MKKIPQKLIDLKASEIVSFAKLRITNSYYIKAPYNICAFAFN